MSYTRGVTGDALAGLGQGPVAMALPEVESIVTGIFGGDKAAAARTADLQAAYARGDAQYLITWINDVPAHPKASVQLAQQLLARLQAGPTGAIKPSVGTMAIAGGVGAGLNNPIVLLLGAGLLFAIFGRR